MSFDHTNHMEVNDVQRCYLEHGFVISKLIGEELDALADIESRIKTLLNSREVTEPLVDVHKEINIDNLNSIRLGLIQDLNDQQWLFRKYFKIFSRILNSIVGTEIAAQRNINLSIQLPNDSSSLLPIHSDVWSGDSPFEVVAWLPLVDCRRSGSMFILPQKHYHDFLNFKRENHALDSTRIHKKFENELHFIEIQRGEALVFNQCLPHGNIVNTEVFSRWSLNARYKSLLSPYGDKLLGEFFIPVNVMPATIQGLYYEI